MNLFDHFKVTQSVYKKSFPFEYFYHSNEKSTLEKIDLALQILVPKPCGHSLIRIGGAGDGGYLLPEDLEGIEALFSPGVNNFKDFEDYLVQNFKIKSYMCDYTSDISKLRTPIIEGMQFFEKKWLDVNQSDDSIDLNDWVTKNTTDSSDLMLQMDIEGAEYRNLLNIKSGILKRFRMIVIELHGLRHLWNSSFLNGILYETLSKIDNDFICVHAHPNNCCGVSTYGDWTVPNVMEFTFLRRDRIKPTEYLLTLPQTNDIPNVPTKAPLHLTGEWLKNASVTDSANNAKTQTIAWLESQLIKKDIQLQKDEVSLKVIHQASRNAINLLRKNHPNIAIHKPSSQSSISTQFLVTNSNSITNGNPSGTYGFHTNLETDPWCILDLQRIEPVLAIIISNRLDSGAHRIRTLRVLISSNQQDWTLVYDHHGAQPFGGARDLNETPALLLNLFGVSLQYLKIELREKTYLHLDQIEIYPAQESHV